MLNLLKDPAKRAEWVYGQPMAPCPKCGSYNMKPQMPIAMETTGDETAPQLLGKWARATKAGATPLLGPAYYCCWDYGVEVADAYRQAVAGSEGAADDA